MKKIEFYNKTFYYNVYATTQWCWKCELYNKLKESIVVFVISYIEPDDEFIQKKVIYYLKGYLKRKEKYGK